MYLRLFLDVVCCDVVEGLCRSCSGFVDVTMGPLGVVRVFPLLFFFVVRCYDVYDFLWFGVCCFGYWVRERDYSGLVSSPPG